jgi:phosphonate transport system ATP-binding protein
VNLTGKVTAVPGPASLPARAASTGAAGLARPVLVVKDLSVTYNDGFTALDRFTLDVRAGEVVALLGHSGSGKSTLMKAITGMAPATATQLTVAGQDVLAAKGAQLRSVRSRVGYVFQHFNLVPQLSALTNVLTGGLHEAGALNRIGLFSHRQRTRALELLDRVGLADKAGQRADSLSGGQQQRVAIARALMQSPQIILADEPVASLDPRLAGSVLGLMRSIAREDGIPVVVSLHVVELARRYADRFVALDSGRTVHSGAIDTLTPAMIGDIYGQEDLHDQDSGKEGAPGANH